MDATFAKSLIDEVIRLNIAYHDITKEHIELQKKYSELQRQHDKDKQLLVMYTEEVHTDIKKNGVGITEMLDDEKEVKKEPPAPSTNKKNKSGEKEISIVDQKKEKRKEYMRKYMEKKRKEKEEQSDVVDED